MFNRTRSPSPADEAPDELQVLRKENRDLRTALGMVGAMVDVARQAYDEVA